MKRPRFKMTGQMHREIIEISRNLPPLQKIDKQGRPLSRATSRLVFGSELPASIEEVNGKPVDPKERYVQRGSEPILVNHTLNLIDTFQHEGPEGMKKYVESVKKVYQATLDKLKAEENQKALTNPES